MFLSCVVWHISIEYTGINKHPACFGSSASPLLIMRMALWCTPPLSRKCRRRAVCMRFSAQEILDSDVEIVPEALGKIV